MYRPQVAPAPRKGIILLVVLALLTLFTIVGLSFVLYADASALQARAAKEGNTSNVPDMNPEECLSLFLDQFIFDVRDDSSGVYSSLRGYSLSRNMYGMNYTWSDVTFPGGGLTPNYITLVNDNVAFNGIGALHYSFPGPAGFTDATAGGAQIDDWKMVNYMYFRTLDGFLRDPERYGIRTALRQPGAADNRGPYLGSANVPYTYPDRNNFYLAAIDSFGNLITPSFHREWLFGRLDAYPGNPNGLAVNSNWTNNIGRYMTMRPRPAENPNFPYPIDRGGDVKNLAGFPGGCDSSWMDIGAPVMTTPDGRKYKMLVAPLILELDGRINLNVHGNIMGNPINGQPTHTSNQGLGPTEVNIGPIAVINGSAPGVLTASNNGVAEWPNLFVGSSLPPVPGRYGPYNPSLNLTPPFPIPVSNNTSFPATTNNVMPPITTPYSYNQIAYRGPVTGTIPKVSGTPNATTGNLPCFPVFPVGYDNASVAARTNHALLYNSWVPYPPSATATGSPLPYNRRFSLSNMERFLRWQDTGWESLTSEVERMCPNNFNNPADPSSFNRRNQVTAISGDINQPGIWPYIWDPSVAVYPNNYVTGTGTTLVQPPKGTPPIFPTPSNPPPQPATPGDFVNTTPTASDWRAASTATNGLGLTRLDLNNPFPNGQHPLGAGTMGPLPGTITTPNAAGLTPYPSTISTVDPPAPNSRFDTDTNILQFQQAQRDRKYLARQIYLRLLAVVGLSSSVPASTTSPNAPAAPSDIDLRPRRWLAQLAVNMVDFIDNDDISTPFHFYTAQDANPTNANPAPTGYNAAAIAQSLPVTQYPGAQAPVPTVEATPLYWVFGTELPRVVINEVLAEYTVPQNPAANTPYANNFWVELYNPMDIVTSTTNPNNVTLANSLPVSLGMQSIAQIGNQTQNGTNGPFVANSGGAYAAYQIVIADQNMLPTNKTNPIPENNNVLGLPYNIRAQTSNTDFGNGSVVSITATNTTQPVNANGPATLGPQSYLIVTPTPFMDANQTVAVNTPTTQAGLLNVGTQMVMTTNMSYQSTITNAGVTPMTLSPAVDNTILANGATVMLQRLANPHIPYNQSPTWNNPVTGNLETNPWYNPYVTIDYIPNVPLYNSTTGPTNGYYSVGKRQPYAGRLIPAPNSSPPNPSGQPSPVTNQINQGSGNVPVQPVQHTLGFQNNPVPTQGFCDWLVQLDRPVTSPVELMHVSQYQPHQLTQQFKLTDPDSGSATFQHAPLTTWYDETTRLYRVFEFFEARDRLAGFTTGNRTTGKININAIWDIGQFMALCDPEPGNVFAVNDVTNIFNRMMALRSPNYSSPSSTFPNYQIGPTNMALSQVAPSAQTSSGGALQADRPFLGLAPGASTGNTAPYYQYPATRGINDTIFRAFAPNADPNSPTAPRLFVLSPNTQNPLTQAGATGSNNPYINHQLLMKIFNNVTTRSNTFAVFLTVGFFEVTNDTVFPVQLGAEMNASESRQIRHRMFAIIDRTVLPQNPYPSTTAATAPAAKTPFRPSSDMSGVVPYWSIIQ